MAFYKSQFLQILQNVAFFWRIDIGFLTNFSSLSPVSNRCAVYWRLTAMTLTDSFNFLSQFSQWPQTVSSRFHYSIYPITFSVGNADEWKKLFKPCAAQRLFLPVGSWRCLMFFLHLFVFHLTTLTVTKYFLWYQVILKDVDSLLYVDTDVLFLRPMDDIWKFLKAFNSTQLAAMAPEHEIPKIGWYSRFARHPFYGVTGVNSGVMLMNLTRIRSTLFRVRNNRIDLTFFAVSLAQMSEVQFHILKFTLDTHEKNTRS